MRVGVASDAWFRDKRAMRGRGEALLPLVVVRNILPIEI
jgi:hypothetical protein